MARRSTTERRSRWPMDSRLPQERNESMTDDNPSMTSWPNSPSLAPCSLAGTRSQTSRTFWTAATSTAAHETIYRIILDAPRYGAHRWTRSLVNDALSGMDEISRDRRALVHALTSHAVPSASIRRRRRRDRRPRSHKAPRPRPAGRSKTLQGLVATWTNSWKLHAGKSTRPHGRPDPLSSPSGKPSTSCWDAGRGHQPSADTMGGGQMTSSAVCGPARSTSSGPGHP